MTKNILLETKFKVYVDLFLARSDFQIQIVNRSRSVKVDALTLNIISPEDLVLVKLLTGRTKDTEDIRQILVENADKLDFEYLNRCSNNLGVNVFLSDYFDLRYNSDIFPSLLLA